MTVSNSRLHRVAPWLSAAVFGVALWLVHRELADYELADIKALVLATPWRALALALLCTMASFAVLVSQDWLALRLLGKRLPLHRVGLAATASYAISNSAGQALISGGSLRLRFYTAWGLEPDAVATIVLFCTLSYFVGVSALLLCSLPWLPHAYFVDPHWTTPLHTGMVLAGALLGVYGFLVLFRDEPLQIKGLSLTLPRPRIALAQTVTAALDLLFSGLALYLLLAPAEPLPFALFLNAYLLAQIVGLFSQVPGGMGVFEGTFMFLLGSEYAGHELLAGLLLYRIVYYFLPLALAGCGLVAFEVHARRWLAHPAARMLLSLARNSLPQVFAMLLLVAGGMLLVSGTTPGIDERMAIVHALLGLPVVELSHMVGSLVGFLLLILAFAVRQRVDAAWYATVLLLGVGIVASLAKGLDFEEALILLGLLLLLLPHRALFYRRSALLAVQLSPGWLALVAAIVAAASWLGFFTYKYVEYSHELWWQFSLDGSASRFLRVTFVLTLLLTALLLRRVLTRGAHRLPAVPTPAELDAAEALVRASDDSQHWLSLVGDKALMWSDDRRAVLAFGVRSRFWIAVGDPCGPPDACESLLWKFREEADRDGADIVFYQVTEACLPLYINMGFSMIKLGEEARVDLAEFGLAGKRRQFLRQRCAQFEREHYEFVVIEKADVPAVLPQLRWISDDWLASKDGREKGFSLGYFDEAYLMRSRIAALRHDGRLLAFANLWESDTRNELSLDLMRYHSSAKGGAMEFLFAQMMLWGKAQGYRWFNLGMAPLAGLADRRLAPRWHKLGNALYQLGNDWYNFEGLRFYKNKFDPVWTPRYLVAPPGLATFNALLQVTALVNRSPAAND